MAGKGGRRVLVTGIASDLAVRLASRLEADDRVDYVAGVDLREPSMSLGRTEFIRADLRNPLVAKVIESTRVDTIVHLSVTAAPLGAGGRPRMKELNVIGTMQLLAAAQRSPRLEKMVVKSTTAVYGSNYADPALFREDVAPGGTPRSGYSKDAVEVEGYARAFGRRRPDTTLTILRFANFVGSTADSPLTRYFSLPVVPFVLGFDPRLQLVHTDDAVEVLERSVLGEHPGLYNVAGPGIVYLSQAIRLAGKPSVGVPGFLASGLAGLVRSTGGVDFSPEQLQFLLYGRVGDIGRLRRTFGYEPRYSTKAALHDFLQRQGVRPLVERQTVERWEHQVYDVVTRARSAIPALAGKGAPAP